ncbi:hypothetical protein ACMGD3_24040 [Lysinibacillus sphaericus]|uniref:hypothetical protein n=1 Tax=Lysinibacillus sphaericus TaxID=1421 RepID=UPI003F7AD7DD
MKFIKLSLTTLSMLFLVACVEPKAEPKAEIIKEESYKIESIKFKSEKLRWDKVIVSTDTETLVLSLEDIVFIKTGDENSTIHVENTKETGAIVDIKITDAKIYLNANDVKKVSKEYAETYSRSLEFK